MLANPEGEEETIKPLCLPHSSGVPSQLSITTAFILLVTALAALAVPVALAQEAGELTISRLQVSLWPEYDDPRLLVIYRGQFAQAEAFPREISFPIPATAQVNATAYVEETGELLANPHEVQPQGDVQVVTYPLPRPTFHFEFYDDIIQGDPANRRFTFTLRLPYRVDGVSVDVQEPLRATGFQVSPGASQVITGSDGFRYFILDLGSLESGQTVQITASYSKPDARPSVMATPAPAVPALPPASEVPAGPGTRPLLLLAALGLGGVGLALIGGAVLMRMQAGRAAPVVPPRPTLTAPGAKPPAVTAAFCTQCGRRLAPGARFCPQCGAPVRVLDVEAALQPGRGAQVNDLLTLRVSRRVLGVLLLVVLVLVALALGWWLGHQTAARGVGWLLGGMLPAWVT